MSVQAVTASPILVSMDEKEDAIVSTGNVSELIELPPMPEVIGELEALARDGLSGGWAGDEILGPSVRPDGSIIMETTPCSAETRLSAGPPRPSGI